MSIDGIMKHQSKPSRRFGHIRPVTSVLPLMLFCITTLAWCQTFDVDQVTAMVQSSIDQKIPDGEIAKYLKKVKLTQQLTDRDIQKLLEHGAGLRTINALKELRDKSASLKPPSPIPAPTPNVSAQQSGPPPPPQEKQDQILSEVRQYAQTYTQQLPNFICTQVTRRWVDPAGSDNFRIIDTIAAKLTYNQGEEHYETVLLNDRPISSVDKKAISRGGTHSTGEFGSLLDSIFSDESQAVFHWDHWGKWNGNMVAVYNYSISREHSSYTLEYEDEQHIVTAYRGRIYADPDSGVVYHVTFEAVDIPSSFPVKSASETLDYGEQTIGGKKYICPLEAKVFLKSLQNTRNDIDFRAYRKFDTESELNYQVDTTSDPDVPLPPGSAPPPPPNHNR